MNTFPEFTRLLNQQLLAQERNATWLARRLQLHPGTVNRWLNQELRPATPELVARIADLLSIHDAQERQYFLLAAGYGYVDSHDPNTVTQKSKSAAERPPLPTLARKHNLPPQPTAFVGREQELTQLLAELVQPDVRLLTIVGFGGIGKTRLALAMAERLVDAFADGVWFVSLVGIDAAASQNQLNPLVMSLADVLSVTFLGSEDPEEQLLRYLQDKEMLLVVDNVEHLLTLSDFFSRLVLRTQRIKLLVTSRERLRLREEWLFRLGALAMPALAESPTPEAMQSLTTYDAIRLFEQQARRVHPTFALTGVIQQVRYICQLVEGIPLGIELAAAWLHQMPLTMIASQIEGSRDFLTSQLRNQPERHRSFRAVFEHSWQLLSAEEQEGLMRLAVFRGGFRRTEVETVTGATLPTLTSLVDKSFLRLNEEGRYNIHELIRQYAAEKLHQVAGRAAMWQERHTRVYLQFVRACGQHLHDEEQMAANAAITAELDNVGIAWEYALQQCYVDEISATQEIMFFFYLLKDRLFEGKEHTAKILSQLRLIISQRAESDDFLKKLKADLGQALSFHAYFQMTTGFMEAAQPIFAESLAVLRPLAKDAPRTLACALLLSQPEPGNTPANQEFFCNELQTSLVLFRQVRDRHLPGILLIHLAQTAFVLGKLDHMEQYLRNSRQYIDAPLWLGYWSMTLGWYYQAKGAWLAAEEEFQQAIDHWLPTQLARIYLAQNDVSTALSYFQAALQLSAVLMTKSLALEAIAGVACCFAKSGDWSRALELLYFVKNHPSTSHEIAQAADRLLADVAANVSPATADHAQQQARAIKLEGITTSLLAEFGRVVDKDVI
jgi:predicted ATPase